MRMMINGTACRPSTFMEDRVVEVMGHRRLGAMVVNDLRNILKDHIHKGLVHVYFEKADGSERDFICTLNEEYLPTAPVASTTPRKDNPDVCRVFVPEIDSWRSFRFDRLYTYELSATPEQA